MNTKKILRGFLVGGLVGILGCGLDLGYKPDADTPSLQEVPLYSKLEEPQFEFVYVRKFTPYLFNVLDTLQSYGVSAMVPESDSQVFLYIPSWQDKPEDKEALYFWPEPLFREHYYADNLSALMKKHMYNVKEGDVIELFVDDTFKGLKKVYRVTVRDILNKGNNSPDDNMIRLIIERRMAIKGVDYFFSDR